MSVTIKSEPYKLELVTGKVPRSHWWKNSDTVESADVWWLRGGGLNRPATDVEIELHQRIKEVPTGITQEDYNAACNKRLEAQRMEEDARHALRFIAKDAGYEGPYESEAIVSFVQSTIAELRANLYAGPARRKPVKRKK
jgi:hypothetical protein